MPNERSTTGGLGWPALLALCLSAHGLVAPRPLASQVPETETQSGREEGGDDGLEVGDVVVTGTRTETPLADSPARLDVITRADIDRSGARDVGELLEEQIGVVGVTRSFRGDSIQLGGLDPEYTLILVDGDRAPGRIGGGIDLGRFTIENVERIEILRGPGSALYGSDAIGGVVNILTRRGHAPARARGLRAGRAERVRSGVAGMLDVGRDGGRCERARSRCARRAATTCPRPSAVAMRSPRRAARA
jgi:outer membrane cobalamin receptor